jgi:HlyD family secretion protein
MDTPTRNTPRTWRRLAVAMLIAAALAAVYRYVSRPTPLPVRLWTVDRGRVEASVANTRAGTIEACRRSHLTPDVGGKVARLPVQEGDRVKANQVLLELWNEDLKAQIQLAESEARAAQARVEEACLLAAVAEREARRQIGLRQKNVTSEEQADRAVTDAKAREAACRAARAGANVSTSRIAMLKADMARTILKAPFDGIIAKVNAELGEFVTPSPPGIPTPPAVDLIDDHCLYVSAPIDEVDAPAIRVDMDACVTLDAFPRRRCSGKVRRIAPYVLEKEKQARTVEVEVALTNPTDLEGLLVGYSADIEVVLETHDDVLRVPTEAVLEGYRVLVYREADSRLEERHFMPGLSNWRFTEVTSGLEAGERVVVSVGREGVQADAYVVPEPSTSTQPSQRDEP